MSTKLIEKMTQLNVNTYHQVWQAYYDTNPIIKSEEDLDWYELTYSLFQDAPLNDINDLWRIVAYTYSWMPTIPDVKPQLLKEPEALMQDLKRLRNGDDTVLVKLLEELIPVINNSLVGVSKVLHFIAPEQVPIIDRNVLSGWEVFFSILHPNDAVPKLPSFKTSLNKRHISKYLEYRKVLMEWAGNCDALVTMRHIENAFFHLGKSITPDHFKVYLPVA